jgi:hypothetical protein
MRRILFYLATPTNKRQYEELTDKAQLQYRERIFPVLRDRYGAGLEELYFADWDWVKARSGQNGFQFWIAAPWSTGSHEDIVLDAMFIQHLELSIVPLIYWDDVAMEHASHDCTYDMSDCNVCSEEEWSFDTAATRFANDQLAIIIPRS